MIALTMEFTHIARKAGFVPGSDGKLDLPPTQETADELAAAAVAALPNWQPGDEPFSVVLTGPGPVWAYLCIAHALHGRVAALRYAAPNTPHGIVVFSHGAGA